jgi:hypothetical protein
MKRQIPEELIEIQCTSCHGKGVIRTFDNEAAYDREDDKMPSGY